MVGEGAVEQQPRRCATAQRGPEADTDSEQGDPHEGGSRSPGLVCRGPLRQVAIDHGGERHQGEAPATPIDQAAIARSNCGP